MSGSSEPDNTGKDPKFGEFVMLSVPPHLISRHFQDLEDSLRYGDNPSANQTYDSKDNSMEDSDGDNSEVSSKDMHDSSSDHRDNQSHDAAANDVCRIGFEKFQEEGISIDDIHLHYMMTQLEISSVKYRGRNRTYSEVTKEEEEENKECEARNQQKDQEASASGFTLVADSTMSASSDPQRNGSERNSNEELFLFSLSLPFHIGRFGGIFCPPPPLKDVEDDLSIS